MSSRADSSARSNAADLVETTERLLERAALDALAIAGKAGQVVSGAAKVEAAIDRDDLAALIHAAEAKPDGKRKLAAALHRNRDENPREIAVFETFCRRAIGFGIEPPKCGTCSPACGAGGRDFSRSRKALRALSDRKLRPIKAYARMRRAAAHEE